MNCVPKPAQLRGTTCWRALFIVAALVAVTGLSIAGSVTYTYDALGRLATATYSNGLVVGFQYDAAGNRTSHVISGATP